MYKVLKYELRRYEVRALDKIVELLEDVAGRHNNRIFYRHVNTLKGGSQFVLVPVKDRNGGTIIDKERVKEKWATHFWNMLNRDRIARKNIEENEKNCDTLDVKEDLFCDEELVWSLWVANYFVI